MTGSLLLIFAKIMENYRTTQNVLIIQGVTRAQVVFSGFFWIPAFAGMTNFNKNISITYARLDSVSQNH